MNLSPEQLKIVEEIKEIKALIYAVFRDDRDNPQGSEFSRMMRFTSEIKLAIPKSRCHRCFLFHYVVSSSINIEDLEFFDFEPPWSIVEYMRAARKRLT